MRLEAWRRRLAWRGDGVWRGGGGLAGFLLAFHLLALPTSANLPLFDVTARMRVLLVPSDTAVGSVIYRLRATDSDFDYPLHFDTNDVTGRSVVVIRDLPCSRNKTHCSANVHLRRSLKDGVKFDFRVSVTDASGDSTVVDCTLRATTPSATAATAAAFPRHPGVVFVSEDAKIGSILDYIIARKNPKNARHVHLEIWGSDYFTVRHSLASPETVNATIRLAKPLDFEKQVVYRIQVLATDPYVDSDTDTRNIAGLQLEIAVVDVQDTPPRFLIAPPTTHLNATLEPSKTWIATLEKFFQRRCRQQQKFSYGIGDVVLRVKAEDGDRGAPRPIRYGLLSRGNPFTPFFRMDDTTGELSLARSLKQLAAITPTNAPLVVLTVLASELVLPPDDDPENSEATAQVALILENLARGPPRFESDQYVARIPEGSSQGTALQFSDPWVPRVKDDDMGRSGFFSLSLEGDNGTFEISPSIAERSANFVIQVKNNRMLDYEKYRELTFKLVATEVASGGGVSGGSSSSTATIYLDDVNDNPPVFLKDEYTAELPENATAGTSVVQVQANDVDTGPFGRVSYTRLLGPANSSLSLDAISGVITVASNDHTFDREAAPEHRLYVEARDEDGAGLRATVPLTIRLLDINDEEPVFTRAAYEFFLDRDGKNFTSEAYVEAIDKDSEPPNNVVRYEIVSGNYENKFSINEITGRIILREPLKKSDSAPQRRPKRQAVSPKDDEEESVIMLNVRAYDLGVPHRWSQASVRVYPRGASSSTRLVLFVVPRSPAEVEADRAQTERILSDLTGGKVSVSEVRPHQEEGRDRVDRNKSDVLAHVLYPANAVVDVHKLTQELISVNSSSTSKEVTTSVVTEYRSDSSALFWLLLFFSLFIVIVILILCCCCACVGCPLYGIHRKRFRIESQESLRPVVQETVVGNVDNIADTSDVKAEEAGEAGVPREAWSAEQKGQQSRNRGMQNGHRGFRRSSVDGVSDDVESLLGRGAHSSPPHSTHRRRGPSLLYSRRLQQKWADEFPVYLEDVEDTPGRRRRVRPTVAGVGARERRVPRRYLLVGDSHHHGQPTRRYLEEVEAREEDSDSMRRHELERGSDHGGGRSMAWAHGGYRQRVDGHVHRRDHFLPGKFAEEDEEGEGAEEEEVVEREGRYVREGDAEILRLVTRGGVEEEGDVTGAGRGGKEILLRRFMEDQHGGDEEVARRKGKDEAVAPEPPPQPPPPPPIAVATQTDSHAQTQTEPPEESEEEISVASSKGGKRKKHHHSRRSRSKHRSSKRSKAGLELKSPIEEEHDGASSITSQMTDIPRYMENKSSILRKMIYRSTENEPSDPEPSARSRRSSEVVKKSFSEMYRSTSSYTHHHPPPFRLNTGGSMSDGEGRERMVRRVTRKRRGSLPESSSRYMDWYKELEERNRRLRRKKAQKDARRVTRREWTHDKTETVHRVTLTVPPSELSKAGSVGNSARVEDDIDSGIAMSQAMAAPPAVVASVGTDAAAPPSAGGGAAFGGVVGGGKKLLEKKSVFDIAYDDMHTKQLRADSISPPY